MLLKLRPNAAPICVHNGCVFCATSHALSEMVGLPNPTAVHVALQPRPATVSMHQTMPFTILQPLGNAVQRLLLQYWLLLQTFEQKPQLLLSVLPFTSQPSLPPLQSRKPALHL